MEAWSHRVGYALLLALVAPSLAAAGPVAGDPVALEAAGLALHTSVSIGSDAQLAAAAPLVRSGSGTADDPLRIHGWDVMRTSAHGIRLANTSLHVVIEDLVVHPPPSLPPPFFIECDDVSRCDVPAAIVLLDASNVTIRNVTSEGGPLLHAERVSRVVVADSPAQEGVFRPDGRMTILDARDVTLRDLVVRFGNDADPVGTFLAHPHLLRVERTSGLLVEDSSFLSVSPRAHLVFGEGMSDVTLQRNRFDAGGVRMLDSPERLRVVHNTFLPFAHLDIGGTRDDPYERVLVCGNFFGIAMDTFHFFGEHLKVVGNTDLEGGWFAFSHIVNATVERNWIGPDGHLVLRSEGLRLVDNHIEPDALGVSVFEPADVRGNWWGSADGPSGHGTGSGAPLHGTVAVDPAPWLASPPSLDVDCASEPLPGP